MHMSLSLTKCRVCDRSGSTQRSDHQLGLCCPSQRSQDYIMALSNRRSESDKTMCLSKFTFQRQIPNTSNSKTILCNATIRVKRLTAYAGLQSYPGRWQQSFTSVVSSGSCNYWTFLPRFPFHKQQKSNKTSFEPALEGDVVLSSLVTLL